MVSSKSVENQLKRIGFSTRGWNRAETVELTAILLPDEEIFECVNGWYEGGFALLCATDVRILLVDKKPMKFLTVEDLRFDMINQIDYGHRFLDAHISVSAGAKSLRFRSYNKDRLRKLIGHVQHRMAETKIEQASHNQSQQEHLKQIDQQLQTYLIAQYQQHESMRRQIAESGSPLGMAAAPQPNIASSPLTAAVAQPDTRPAAEQSTAVGWANGWLRTGALRNSKQQTQTNNLPTVTDGGVRSDELYEDGVREVFAGRQASAAPTTLATNAVQPQPAEQEPIYVTNGYPSTVSTNIGNPLEINPLRIAYSKLPMLLRNRQYGRTSLNRSAKPTSYEAVAS